MSYDPYQDCQVEYHADLWIDGKAPRRRKIDRHLRALPGQPCLEIGDDLRAAAWDVLFGFREVKGARIVVSRVHVLHHDGCQETIRSTDAPWVEEELI